MGIGPEDHLVNVTQFSAFSEPYAALTQSKGLLLNHVGSCTVSLGSIRRLGRRLLGMWLQSVVLVVQKILQTTSGLVFLKVITAATNFCHASPIRYSDSN